MALLDTFASLWKLFFMCTYTWLKRPLAPYVDPCSRCRRLDIFICHSKRLIPSIIYFIIFLNMVGFLVVQGLHRNAVEISLSRGSLDDILFHTPERHEVEVMFCVLAKKCSLIFMSNFFVSFGS